MDGELIGEFDEELHLGIFLTINGKLFFYVRIVDEVISDGYFGLRENFGAHSLRKTWGYHARLQGVDLAIIMHNLNHSNLSIAKRYLGITSHELETIINKLNL